MTQVESVPVSPKLSMDARTQRVLIYASLTFTPMAVVGLIFVHGFPPTSPNASAAEIARIYSEHRTRVEIGSLILTMGAVVYAMFGAVRTFWILRMEAGRFPFMALLSAICITADVALTELDFALYGIAGFRAGDISPDTTQTLNDLANICTVFLVAPILIEMLAFAVAVFRDGNSPRIFPRSLGWVNVGAIIGSLGASLVILTKTGPFAWNGLIGYWLTFAVFGVWSSTMDLQMLKAITAEQRTHRTLQA